MPGGNLNRFLQLDGHHRLKELSKTIDIPTNELEWVLCELFSCPRIELYLYRHRLREKEARYLSFLLESRRQGEPLQYLLGKTEFMGLEFKVDSGVFIPRPETELLTDKVIEYLRHNLAGDNYPRRILDIGTGVGNISISIAKYIPFVDIDAIDILPQAISCASKNARLHNVEDRIRFIQMDIKDWKKDWYRFKRYDIIVSNPPYIPVYYLGHLPPEVKREPVCALDGGQRGIDYYYRISEMVPYILRKGGMLFLEIPEKRALEIRDIFTALGMLVELSRDLAGKYRILKSVDI